MPSPCAPLGLMSTWFLFLTLLSLCVALPTARLRNPGHGHFLLSINGDNISVSQNDLSTSYEARPTVFLHRAEQDPLREQTRMVTAAHFSKDEIAKRSPAVSSSNQPSPTVGGSPSRSSSTNSGAAGDYASFVLGQASTSPSVAPPSETSAGSSSGMPVAGSNSPTCPASNGTIYSSGSRQYLVTCDVDIPSQEDILPFLLATSYAACVAQCDEYTSQNPSQPCLGVVFASGRENDADDCYLKSSLNNSIPAALPLIGAFLLPPSNPSAASSPGSNANISGAAGTSVIPPKIASSQLHGTATNNPTTQYVNHTFPAPITLPSDILVAGINDNLTTGFPIAGDTGPIVFNSTFKDRLAPLTVTPHLSRDGGKGGCLGGQHIFIFCDTASFGTTNATTEGDFLGFISSSVAVDTGMNGLNGKPLTLQDGIGEWGDNVGRLRGFAPMTTGEEAYNLAMSGGGHRYAIWPDSSLIPLDNSSALLYPPIVYDKVDMTTQAANFTYIGNTLLTVTTDDFGPTAERTVKRMFEQDQVQWGSAGGIRSWGPSGIGGTDGRVYIFGKVANGLLLARTTPDSVADQSSYTYWNGTSWTPDMLPPTSTAYFINETIMDLDVFYSPLHRTFIMVYLSAYADSTFYYRYLLADHSIIPPYAPIGDPTEDYVESIVKYNWSDEQVLYKAAKPPAGNYIYAGSVHAGYFGTDDITMGGSKMLLSWTANTGEPAASVDSGYALITAEVDLST